MSARRDEQIVTAVFAKVEIVDRMLNHLRVVSHARDDLRQEVVITAWTCARRGAFRWSCPRAMRAFLRTVTIRTVYGWWASHPITVELREEHEPTTALDAERRYLGKEAMALARRATTPERWRAIAAYAKGIPVSAIARREGIPVATVYNRIRDARRDIGTALRREDAAICVRTRK